jgi:two-component system sensor histidine kinase KdpD
MNENPSARAMRGRLKVYLAPSVGAGKTRRLLEECRRLKAQGVDVVLAFIETRALPDTEALLPGLEILPRYKTLYRGLTAEEMDLDAALLRKPRAAVIDDLAHTNVPGSRNKKRYQDVLSLLEAGIDVITAMDVQHLESLNGVVEKATGAAVRETVPDSFLREADQVVSLDLSADELAERLKAGRTLPPEEAALLSLRELALRETANVLESDRKAGRPSSMNQRVMVGLSLNPERALALLRRGSRMAGRLNTDWYAVYVEPPAGSRGDAEGGLQGRLGQTLETAKEWGARVVRLRAQEPAAALLDFARAQGVGHIVVGRSPLPWWRRFIKKSVLLRLLQEAEDFDVHVVALEEEA